MAVGRGARVEALVPEQIALDVRRPELVAVRAPQADDRAGVGRDADTVSPDRRARVDSSPRVVGPADGPAGHVDGEEPPVGRAEVGGVVDRDRRRFDPTRRPDTPEHLPVRTIEPGDGAVVRADDQSWACDRRRRSHEVRHLASPDDVAVLGVDREGRPFRVVDVQSPVAERRRILHEPDGPTPDRLRRPPEIDVLAGEGALRVPAEREPAGAFRLRLGLLRLLDRLDRLLLGGRRQLVGRRHHRDSGELGVDAGVGCIRRAQVGGHRHAGQDQRNDRERDDEYLLLHENPEPPSMPAAPEGSRSSVGKRLCDHRARKAEREPDERVLEEAAVEERAARRSPGRPRRCRGRARGRVARRDRRDVPPPRGTRGRRRLRRGRAPPPP